MEVWALEAYGASHNLQELLTIKSDDVKGRNAMYNALIRGLPLPQPGLPETFKLLTKQLQGLGLTVDAIYNDGHTVDINSYSSVTDYNVNTSKQIDTVEEESEEDRFASREEEDSEDEVF